MARIKFEFKLKKVARLFPTQGPPVIVGEVEEYIEKDGKVNVTVKLDKRLSKLQMDKIIENPGMLSFTSMSEGANPAILLPDLQ